MEREIADAGVLGGVPPDVEAFAQERVFNFLDLSGIEARDLQYGERKAEGWFRHDAEAILIFSLPEERGEFDAPGVALAVQPAFAAEPTVDEGFFRDAMGFKWHRLGGVSAKVMDIEV